VRLEHLNTLISQPQIIDQADLIGVPGGFSYGDDIAAGRIFANRLRHQLIDQLHAAVDRGVPIIGICNGFQVLVKLQLLPDPHAQRQTATLADNTCGRFVDRWTRLEVPDDTKCIWTAGLTNIELPIAHGEGRFVPESDESLARWQANGQVALRYASDDNPNGSVDNIAGVCDPTGLVLGLMPHPERFVHLTNHPRWTRLNEIERTDLPMGLQFFRNAVQYVQSHQTAEVQA